MSVADIAEAGRRVLGFTANTRRLVGHAVALLDEARAGYELLLQGTHDPEISRVPGTVGEAAAALKSLLGQLAAIEALLAQYLASIGANTESAADSTATPARVTETPSRASRWSG